MGLKSVAELDMLLAAAASGDGSPMLDQRLLLQLLGYGLAKDWIVDAIEVYELKDGQEIPLVEFTLLGGDLVAETAGMPFDKCMTHIFAAVDFTLSAVADTGRRCGFLVWLAPIHTWRDSSPA